MPFPLSFTEASRGPHTPDMRSGSTSSTSAAFGVSFRPNGRTDSPTPICLNEPTCRASLHYSSKDAYGGSVMFTVWNPIASQGKSSTGNCGRAPDAWAEHSFALRMFASVSDLRLAEINPNTWEVIAQDRDACRHGMKEGALRAETKARA